MTILLAALLLATLQLVSSARNVSTFRNNSAADNSVFRGNLAYQQPVSTSSTTTSMDTIVNGLPDWTDIALEPAKKQTSSLSAYKDDEACPVLESNGPRVRPFVSVDLGKENPVGFVRVFDAVDTLALEANAQHVIVVVSSTKPTTARGVMSALQDSNSHFKACGGRSAVWNVSSVQQPVDVPCFSHGRYVSILGQVGESLRLCSVEVHEMNHDPLEVSNDQASNSR